MRVLGLLVVLLAQVNAAEQKISDLYGGIYALKKNMPSLLNVSSSGPVQTPCAVGLFRREIGEACLECPIGWFNDIAGGEDATVNNGQLDGGEEFENLRSTCKLCTMGYYTNEEGFSECVKCPSGFANTGLYTDNRYMFFDGKVGKQAFLWIDAKVPTTKIYKGFESEEEVSEMRKPKGEDTDLEAIKKACDEFGECNSFCTNPAELTIYYNTDGEQELVDAGSEGWTCFKKDGQKEGEEVMIDGKHSLEECEYQCSTDDDCMAFDYNRLKRECTKRLGVCFTGHEEPFKGDEDSCVFHCPVTNYWDGSACQKETPGLVYCGCKQYFDASLNACKVCPDKKFSFDQHHQMDISHCMDFPEEDCPEICGIGSGMHWDTVLGCIEDVEGEEYCNCRQYAIEPHNNHPYKYSEPDKWKDSYPYCGGQAQSPIDIDTSKVQGMFRQALSFVWEPIIEVDVPLAALKITDKVENDLILSAISMGPGCTLATAQSTCLLNDDCVGFCQNADAKTYYYKTVDQGLEERTGESGEYACFAKKPSIRSVWDDDNFKVGTPVAGTQIAQNGHSEYVSGKFGSFYNYEVQQFNFHAPSEHTVDGKQYAAEMHIVAKQDDDHLVVFAIFFEEADEANTWLESAQFSNAPNVKGPVEGRKPVDITESIEPFSAFQTELDGGYYHYPGSLTTPPCNEVVSWFVFDTPAKIGKDQLAYFKAIFPDPMNNRPVQEKGTRIVEYGNYLDGEQETGEASLSDVALLQIDAYRLGREQQEAAKDVHHRKCMPCPFVDGKKSWVGDNKHDAHKYMCVPEPEMVHGEAVITTGWRSCYAAGTDRCQDACEGFIMSGTCDPLGEIGEIGGLECHETIATENAGYCVCDKTKRVGAYGCEPKPFKNCNEACDTDHFATWRQTSDCKWDGVRDIMNDKAGDTELDHRFGGYCECEDRTKGGIFQSTNVKVMKATCDPKTHPYKTCTEACEALWSGKLITIHADGEQDDTDETHIGEIPTQPGELPNQKVLDASGQPTQLESYCYYEKLTCARCTDEEGSKAKAECIVKYMECEKLPPVKKCIGQV